MRLQSTRLQCSRWLAPVPALLLGILGLAVSAQKKAPPTPAKPSSGPVSYHKQIWPILQAKCQGCHQPASDGGKLVVTSYAGFLKGGEHGVAFTAGKVEASPVLEYLTGKRTLMPKGGPPLPAADIALFRRWIAEGAKDDTPAAKDPIDAAHPPVYTASPVITALAYAPDSSALAVSGYREILLHKPDGSGLLARLVGQSPKILSLVYSQDSRMLIAAGGAPAVFGEIQFWDAPNRKLINAVHNGYDTNFGASLSPDGKEVGFGCSDNSVRVVTVPDGKQVLKFDNHSDWVLATAFAMDSKHILSTGRDQAVKLIVVDGGSFIDDINTHVSPYRAMVRNPKADQVLVAGDDGMPRIYQVFRTKPRTMNQEDHNLLRAYEKQPATVTALAFSADGSMIAVGSEGDVVNVYKTDNGPAESDKPAIGAKPLATLRGHKGAIYALAFSPDGKQLATGGFDGTVRIYNLPEGTLAKSFIPVPLTQSRTTIRASR